MNEYEFKSYLNITIHNKNLIRSEDINFKGLDGELLHGIKYKLFVLTFNLKCYSHINYKVLFFNTFIHIQELFLIYHFNYY